jgi:hypothetical protein
MGSVVVHSFHSFVISLYLWSTAVAKFTNYEFTEEQNRVIAVLANRILVLGIVLIAIGIPILAMIFKGDLVATSIGALYILMGTLSLNSYASFRRIVTTTHRDISNLMDAMKALATMYTLQILVFVGSAIAFVVFELRLLQ